MLGSGSDDRSMRVWRYTGDGAQCPLVVDTLHQGNIFGVAFLPATDNRELVSGAMDYSGEGTGPINQAVEQSQPHKHQDNIFGVAFLP